MSGTDDRHCTLLPKAILILHDAFTARNNATKKNMSLAAALYLVTRKTDGHHSTVMKMASRNEE
jgi:hypothetical protein